MENGIGTSNLSELPFNNQNLNTVNNNENIITNEISNISKDINNNTNNTNNSNNNSLDYNALVNDLQKATANGATSLPSRDIPLDTANIAQDIEIQPDYIPNNNIDYIGNQDNMDNVQNNNNNSESLNYYEDLYSNLQIPILISVLYFIFQLPYIKKILLKQFPNLFGKDGNQNIYGYIFYSIMFGVSYIFIMKLIEKLSEI